jgi:hypothetical protein
MQIAGMCIHVSTWIHAKNDNDYAAFIETHLAMFISLSKQGSYMADASLDIAQDNFNKLSPSGRKSYGKLEKISLKKAGACSCKF